MFTNDVNFYTVKQIDNYLDKNAPVYEMGVASLEHTRNILIDRLKTRLAMANGMGHSIRGEKRAKLIMDLGFANYKKIIDLTIGDGWSRTVQNPPQEIEENFRKFAGDLLDKVGGIKEAKFVFCDESIEFKFRTKDEITFSFELFYDTTTSFIASAFMEPTKFFATEFTAYHLEASLEYVKNVTMELVSRKEHGLL